jgi:hypothetical protein
MVDLKEKKILLLAAKFFNYETEIANRLRDFGAIVDYFDQRPSNSFLTKALIRINSKFLSKKIDDYYKKIIDETESTRYDYVLFISPEAITKKIFLKLKDKQQYATYILYMWDAIKNKNQSTLDLVPLFDCRFSFDKEDSSDSTYNFTHRPLFYLNDYRSIPKVDNPKYDLLFIGTIHSDRYRILKSVKLNSSKNNQALFFYPFFPSKILFLVKLLVDPSLWHSKLKEFKFRSLDKRSILNLFETSRAIIDIQHPRQTGLTMRTIEVLGAQRKLITTNKDIVTYDFYNPNNIHVIDRENAKVDSNFLYKPLVPLTDKILWKYSLDGWISDIFSPQK